MEHSIQSVCEMMEPVLQRVVREVVQQKFDQYVDSLERIKNEQSPNLQLVFEEEMPDLIYNKGKIRTKDNKPLRVKLIDAATGDVVAAVSPPSGPLKVEIVVLDGDFPASGRRRNRGDHWTSEDFRSSLLKERTGKRPLLVGERTASLVHGRTSFEALEFTDNSRWRPSGKFVLGVAALPGIAAEGPRIREGITKPFKVLENRGELYKKHVPPRPNDEVWRLKQIAKDGAFHKKLNEANVRTVEDFLRLLRDDPGRLFGILGKSEKTWKITIRHAETCKFKKDAGYYNSHQEGQTSYMDYDLDQGGMMESSWDNNISTVSAHQQGSGTFLNNMQTDYSFEDMDFGQGCDDPYQCHGYPSQAPR